MEEHFFLGEGYEISTDPGKTQLNNNIMVVGPSGAGKTMSYAEMCLLKTFDTSLIVTLTKRRLVKKYKTLFREKGYAVYDLNLVTPEESDVSYDPMMYLRTQADITHLARSIVMADPRKSTAASVDPFWDAASISLLSALIAYECHVRTRPSFSDVLELFGRLRITDRGDSIETSLDTMFDRLSEEDTGSFAWQCWKTFRYAPMRTAGSIYSSLSVTIDTIFTPQLQHAMKGRPPLDLLSLSRKKSVLFVTTSAVNPSLDAFAGILYSHAIKELFEHAESRPDGTLEIPVHLLCDDFATGARIPDFPYYISIFREKGISISILLQSESQLQYMYGQAAAQTIINNCDRYIYMGGSDLATCQSMAQRLGKSLSDVLYMPLGTEYILERGRKPVFTSRWQITDDADWKALERSLAGSQEAQTATRETR